MRDFKIGFAVKGGHGYFVYKFLLFTGSVFRLISKKLKKTRPNSYFEKKKDRDKCLTKINHE